MLVGGEECANGFEQLAAQDLALDREPTALVVVEQDAPLTELVLEDLVFRAQVLDHRLLLAVHPAGQDGEQKLPGLQDELAQNHG